ncbi:YIP1 family protein [Bacillus testis]|uniref:YIP1 family protein n=1 Tax=Bacillus testis TaxID=1622072 RepID=UPI00067F5B79|nr:YIP1 family protein [Bacillus testis]
MKFSPVEAMEVKAKEPKPSLLGIMVKPVEHFERIRKNPVIWMPIIVLAILFAAGIYLNYDQEAVMKEINKTSSITLSESDKELMKTTSMIFAIIAGIIAPLIGALVKTIVYQIAAKILKAPVAFKQLFSMCLHISFLSAIALLVSGAIRFAFGLSGSGMLTGISYYMGESGRAWGSIELFSIWTLVLSAIGLYRTAHFSKKAAWGIPIVLFIIGMLFHLLGASIS